jgi:hypothetical protein
MPEAVRSPVGCGNAEDCVGLNRDPLRQRHPFQHAGPKLSGYATSAAATTTVTQNATPGFLREEVIYSPPIFRDQTVGRSLRSAQ